MSVTGLPDVPLINPLARSTSRPFGSEDQLTLTVVNNTDVTETVVINGYNLSGHGYAEGGAIGLASHSVYTRRLDNARLWIDGDADGAFDEQVFDDDFNKDQHGLRHASLVISASAMAFVLAVLVVRAMREGARAATSCARSAGL